MHSKIYHFRRYLTLLALMLVSRPVSAQDLPGVLTDYTIESWTQKDGLPSGLVFALAQDQEGYLWIGSAGGLLRFDGVRFMFWEGPGIPDARREVRSFLVSRDGAVWVGFGGSGGISRVTHSGSRYYGTSEGLPRGAAMALTEDPNGALWAATEHGLFTLRGERWQEWEADGLANVLMYGAMFDRRGDFYLGTALGVFVRRSASSRFERLEPPSEDGMAASGDRTVGPFPRTFGEDAAGNILVNDWSTGARVVVSRTPVPKISERGRGYRVLLDRNHDVWVGTIGQGLWRVRWTNATRSPEVDRARAITGLPSDSVTALFEDREGNIWAGMGGAIGRLTKPRVAQLLNYDVVSAIEATTDGSVWLTAADKLLRFRSNRPPGEPETVLSGVGVQTIRSDTRGDLWVITARHLLRMRAGSSQITLSVPLRPSHRFDLITDRPGGGVWLYDRERGLYRWDRELRPVNMPHLPAGSIDVLFTDSRGHLWMGLTDSRITVLSNDQTLGVYGREHGWDIGVCRYIFEDRNGRMWFAATGGIALLEDDRFITLKAISGVPLTNASALVDDELGDLWVATRNGIWRLTTARYPAIVAVRLTKGDFNRYTELDGVAGMPHAFNRNNRAVRGAAGRLWFVTSRGVSILDPRVLRDIQPTAPVQIEFASTGDTRITPIANRSLPAGTTRLEIIYSALNLTSPLRTRFRYRLEGSHGDWIDGGSNRQAIYTNLGPGHYEFRVVATDGHGAWAEPGASWSFSISPFFYQTGWFRGLIVGLLLLSIWSIWQLRVRHLQRAFALILAERVRLSRELHDTLLQSLVGIALQFDAMSLTFESLPPSARRHFVRMRKQLEEHISEARQAIYTLRSSSNERRELVAALADIGKRATSERNVIFSLNVSGEPRRFSPRVKAELLRIAQEAMTNAMRHANGSHLIANVQYGDTSIAVEIVDDGRGFDVNAATNGSTHYGLTSMRERAEDVGGVLEITSSAGRGTHVRAVVPLVQAAMACTRTFNSRLQRR